MTYSDEWIAAEREKCRNDFFYWLENYSLISTGDKPPITPTQREYIEAILAGKFVAIPRRLGVQTCSSLLFAWRKETN